MFSARLALLAPLALLACASSPESSGVSRDRVVVDTGTAGARAQYDADLAFARGYAAQCAPSTTSHRRVLVAGFGRFESITRNATGQIVSALVPAATYPQTSPPEGIAVDPPAPQLRVAVGSVTLDRAGDVDVCAMILPVYWDLAPILLAREIDAFGPELVVMNGVAGDRQPLWIELGSVNEAMAAEDGSRISTPITNDDGSQVPLVASAAPADHARGLRLSWDAVRNAARDAITARADRVADGVRFGDVVQGALFGGFPRASNTYLCNDVAYVTGYLMDHSGGGDAAALMQASTDPRGGIDVGIARDVRATPRVFVHWPSDVDGDHVATSAEILRAMIDAQLAATDAGDLPTTGTNDRAEVTDSTGGTF